MAIIILSILLSVAMTCCGGLLMLMFKQRQQAYDIEKQLSNQNIELSTKLAASQDNNQALVQRFTSSDNLLREQFKALSEDILTQREQGLISANQTQLGLLLDPLKEKIDQFQQRINQVHADSTEYKAKLDENIQQVSQLCGKISNDANNLARALKGDAQQRGAWGEAQLKLTLEASGLQPDIHYSTQTSFLDAENKRKQTDFIIHLPEDKHLVIDSKVLMIGYERLVNSEDDTEKSTLLTVFIRSIKQQIDNLASKQYNALPGINSPDYVLMFMPIEAAYVEAMKHDKGLFQYGYSKGVVLVSHTTLMPILRLVDNLWKTKRRETEMLDIEKKVGEIYDAAATVSEKMEKLGNSIGQVSKQYNDTMTSLTGTKGLFPRAQRFIAFSKKAKPITTVTSIEEESR